LTNNQTNKIRHIPEITENIVTRGKLTMHGIVIKNNIKPYL